MLFSMGQGPTAKSESKALFEQYNEIMKYIADHSLYQAPLQWQ